MGRRLDDLPLYRDVLNASNVAVRDTGNDISDTDVVNNDVV